MSSFLKSNKITPIWLPILISVIGLGFSVCSFVIANNISRDNLAYELDQTSLNYVSDAYDELYYKSDNSYVMHLLRENIFVKDMDAYRKVIDIFEGIGSNYCQGSIKKKHIYPYFYNTTKYICYDSQLDQTYSKGQKNGIAILCKEFYPESPFAYKIDMTNVGQCGFFDSSVFKNNPNLQKYKFPKTN